MWHPCERASNVLSLGSSACLSGTFFLCIALDDWFSFVLEFRLAVCEKKPLARALQSAHFPLWLMVGTHHKLLAQSIVGGAEFENWIKVPSFRLTVVVFIVSTMRQFSNNFCLMIGALTGNFA